MIMMLYNKTQNTLISKEVTIAKSFWDRLMGLMFKANLHKEKCLWIKDCPSIHTFFMRFPIDVVFLDKNMRVLKVIDSIQPWRMTAPFQFKNDSCLEFSANKTSQKIFKGDQLDVRP